MPASAQSVRAVPHSTDGKELRTVRVVMVMLGACELALGIVWLRGRLPARRPLAAGRPRGEDPVRVVLVGGLLVVIGGLTLWLSLRR
jgi:hypothetical protein